MKKAVIRILHQVLLSCDQATYLIVRGENQRISPKEKFTLYLHLLACKYCRIFKKQSRWLEGFLHQMHHDPSQISSQSQLKPVVKAAMDELIREQLPPLEEN